jgi:hypothetical protein
MHVFTDARGTPKPTIYQLLNINNSVGMSMITLIDLGNCHQPCTADELERLKQYTNKTDQISFFIKPVAT